MAVYIFNQLLLTVLKVFWLYPNLLPIPTALVFINTERQLAVLPKFPNVFRWFSNI